MVLILLYPVLGHLNVGSHPYLLSDSFLHQWSPLLFTGSLPYSFVCWISVQQANGLWNPSSPTRDLTQWWKHGVLTTVLPGNSLSYSFKGNHLFFHVFFLKKLWIRDLGLQVTQQFCLHPWLVCLAGKYRYCLDSLPPLPRLLHLFLFPSRTLWSGSITLQNCSVASIFTFGWSPNCLKWHVVLSRLLSLFCLHSSPLPAAPTPCSEFPPTGC